MVCCSGGFVVVLCGLGKIIVRIRVVDIRNLVIVLVKKL